MAEYVKMAVALETSSEVEARIVASLLEGYAIRAVVRGRLSSSVYPLGYHEAALLVPESQLAEADRLIRSHRAHLRLVYSRDRDD